MVDAITAVITLIILLFILIIALALTIKTVHSYEQAVVVIFGSYKGTLNPGFHFVSPVSKLHRVDVRTRRAIVPPSRYETPWGPLFLTVEVAFRVTEAAKFVFSAQDPLKELTSKTRITTAEVLASAPLVAQPPATIAWASAEVKTRLIQEYAKFGAIPELAELQPAGQGGVASRP